MSCSTKRPKYKTFPSSPTKRTISNQRIAWTRRKLCLMPDGRLCPDQDFCLKVEKSGCSIHMRIYLEKSMGKRKRVHRAQTRKLTFVHRSRKLLLNQRCQDGLDMPNSRNGIANLSNEGGWYQLRVGFELLNFARNGVLVAQKTLSTSCAKIEKLHSQLWKKNNWNPGLN